MIACGFCGKDFEPARPWEGTRFCSRRCANSRSRKGGVFYSGGRWLIKCRDGTLLLYYRAVMAGHIGRLLTKGEHVHHINGDPTDDRIENLMLTTASEHMRMHQEQLQAGRGR